MPVGRLQVGDQGLVQQGKRKKDDRRFMHKLLTNKAKTSVVAVRI